MGYIYKKNNIEAQIVGWYSRFIVVVGFLRDCSFWLRVQVACIPEERYTSFLLHKDSDPEMKKNI